MLWMLILVKDFLRRDPRLFWPRAIFFFSSSVFWLILAKIQRCLQQLKTFYQNSVKSHTKMTFSLSLFVLIFTFRYLRLIVNTIAFLTLKSFPISQTPSFTSSRDVTVVVPTVFKNPADVMQCLTRIIACNPLQLIVVTSNDLVPIVQKELLQMNFNYKVQVIGVAKLNKRTQMITALKQAVRGKVVAFADDDVFWPNTSFIDTMLACFENPNVGAAGPSQQVVRYDDCNVWNFLGICYLERRNFNTGATNRIDGAVSTLSGRTSFYRAHLIQNEQFYDFFMNALNHDDDKNLTRWIFDLDMQIVLQFDPSARIKTTLETSGKLYIRQCMRWARGHWRGNFRVMSTTTYWYNKHLWSLYAIYIGQFQTPAILIDPGLALLLYNGLAPYSSTTRTYVMAGFALWVFLTKVVKIIPHFLHHPADMKYIPAMILFSYVHGFMNVYALFTQNSKGW